MIKPVTQTALRPQAVEAFRSSGHIVEVALWTIRAEYDPEAKVWWAADSDVPGLAADADTLEGLAAKAGSMLRELLAIHEDKIPDRARLMAPHRIRIIAHHERLFDVAA